MTKILSRTFRQWNKVVTFIFFVMLMAKYLNLCKECLKSRDYNGFSWAILMGINSLLLRVKL